MIVLRRFPATTFFVLAFLITWAVWVPQYGFVVEPLGRGLAVYTIAAPGASEYAGWKAVVDQAAQTLEFTSG